MYKINVGLSRRNVLQNVKNIKFSCKLNTERFFIDRININYLK